MSTNKNKDIDFITDYFLPLIQASINCQTIAKVVRISGNEADCQPLPLQSNGDKRGMLISCLVAKQAMYYPNSTDGTKLTKLHVGNEVTVSFLDRDMDNYSNGEFSLASRRMHSINDGIVLGVLK